MSVFLWENFWCISYQVLQRSCYSLITKSQTNWAVDFVTSDINCCLSQKLMKYWALQFIERFCKVSNSVLNRFGSLISKLLDANICRIENDPGNKLCIGRSIESYRKPLYLQYSIKLTAHWTSRSEANRPKRGPTDIASIPIIAKYLCLSRHKFV